MSTPNDAQASRLRRTTTALAREAHAAEHRSMGLAQEFKAFILRGNVMIWRWPWSSAQLSVASSRR